MKFIVKIMSTNLKTISVHTVARMGHVYLHHFVEILMVDKIFTQKDILMVLH